MCLEEAYELTEGLYFSVAYEAYETVQACVFFTKRSTTASERDWRWGESGSLAFLYVTCTAILVFSKLNYIKLNKRLFVLKRLNCTFAVRAKYLCLKAKFVLKKAWFLTIMIKITKINNNIFLYKAKKHHFLGQMCIYFSMMDERNEFELKQLQIKLKKWL